MNIDFHCITYNIKQKIAVYNSSLIQPYFCWKGTLKSNKLTVFNVWIVWDGDGYGNGTCRDRAMDYRSTKFGVDGSGIFPFRLQTDKQMGLNTLSLSPAGGYRAGVG